VDNELEVIRDEMELTRANLADKLGALENQVRETVSGATDAVSSTVEGVKEVVSSVSETVESVTETFNVSKQVEQHPWMAFGAAVAAGFVVAQVIGRSSQPAPAPPPPAPPPPRDLHRQPPAESHAEPHNGSGVLHSLESMLPDMSGVMNTVVSNLSSLAVGGLMGVIREMASGGLPEEWKGEATKLIDQVTTQLGGKPLDSTRSNQLLDALGLGGQSHDVQTQPAQGPQGGNLVGNGTHGVVSAGRQPTTQTW
jgi:ElaB/YqjD/DUF883 family membrane-anchored ribosome-binding protein